MSLHLFEVLNYALKKAILVSINTNGVYLDEGMIDKLRMYPNLDQITVSVDGGGMKRTMMLYVGEGRLRRWCLTFGSLRPTLRILRLILPA